MFKKLLTILVMGIFLFVPGAVSAQDSSVNLYLFWSKTCPHCAKEKVFLQQVTPKYPSLKVHYYEISDLANAFLLQQIGEKLRIETGGVPVTIIGNTHLIGYQDDATTGEDIKRLIESTAKNGDPDPVGAIIRNEPLIEPSQSPQVTPVPELPKQENSQSIKVPILGNLDTKSVSLPVLTVIIAAMDGFNPCAMWTLLFLISLLLGMKDRKRMWILGGTFIISSAVVYFLFLSAWLNLFLFLGFVTWVRLAIGLFALATGGYYLVDFVKNKSDGCNVMGDKKRQKIFERLKAITQRKEFLLALGGIILLAFAVNLVELICSAGLPAIYTNVLSLSHLPVWQYYAYLILYIFIFMLDDLFIFFSAMITLQASGIQSKYSHYSHFVGGILMVVIGLLMIFKPEWLMFG